LFRRFRSTLHVQSDERELAREIGAHLRLLEDEGRRKGLTADDARFAARRTFGGVEQAKERHRDERSFRWLNEMRRDASYATRLLGRNPIFTITAVLSITVGIGGTTAIFSVANGLLFRQAPGVVAPDRLVDVNRTNGRFGVNLLSYSEYLDIKQRATSLDSMFAYKLELTPMSLEPSVRDGALVEAVFGDVVTTNYFSALGVIPAAGRLFAPTDSEQFDASPIVVLSHRMWTRRFDARPSVVGRALSLNGHVFTIVGVADEAFRGTTILAPDLWVPVGAAPFTDKGYRERNAVWGLVGARLRPGVLPSQAGAELYSIGRALQRDYPGEIGSMGLSLSPSSPIPSGLRAAAAGFLALLMGLVSVVLVIACANVAGVLLARATARRREIAVRLAMGAGRARLIRQLLTETIMLFVLGGAAGLALASGLTSLLLRLLPASPVPIDLSIALDGRVVAFGVALSLAAALLSGLAPALHASKADVVAVLKHDVQGPADRLRLRSAFVVAQVAFSLLLVVVAGVLVSALGRMSARSQGFDADGMEAISLDLALANYTDSTGLAFAAQLLDQARRLPELQTAAIAAASPGGGGLRFSVVVPGVAPPDGEPSFQAGGNAVAPGYFATMRAPLVAGRDFTDSDRGGAQPVAIVTESAARSFWSVARAEDAIGRSLALRRGMGPSAPSAPALLVVGVARDASTATGDSQPPFIYVPLAQWYSSTMVLLTRSVGGLRASGAVRALVATLDPKLPIVSVRALHELEGPVATQLRVSSAISGGVGVVGLLLAALGIYGVTAYAVTRRTRELGIRIALGARPADVLRLVLVQGASLVATGSVIGLAMALAASRLLKRLIYGIPAVDPVSFTVAVAGCLAIGVLACWFPARRATRIDPLAALRVE
jgi:predicted permease